MKPDREHDPGTVMTIRKVGIALAAYQPDIRFLGEQLRSIQDQIFRNWTCWITLDSRLEPPKTEPILEPFFKHRRFKWLENAVRLGHKKNFERAMNLAASDPEVDAVACSDQDDVWLPHKLRTCIDAISRSGRGTLVHSDMFILNPDGSTADDTAWRTEARGIENATLPTLLVRNVVAGCSMLVDAELIRTWPSIPDAFDYHDHWYAVVAAGNRGVFAIHEPLYLYRQHGANVAGITPFRGIFAMSGNERGLARIARKSLELMRKTESRTRAALNGNLPVPGYFRRIAATTTPDAGLGYLFFALANLTRDLPLARAAGARALGKLLALSGITRLG